MSDLTPRGGRRVSRSERERRAYQLIVAGGAGGAVFVVGTLLAIFGVIGMGLPLLGLVVAVISGVLFRRSVG